MGFEVPKAVDDELRDCFLWVSVTKEQFWRSGLVGLLSMCFFFLEMLNTRADDFAAVFDVADDSVLPLLLFEEVGACPGCLLNDGTSLLDDVDNAPAVEDVVVALFFFFLKFGTIFVWDAGISATGGLAINILDIECTVKSVTGSYKCVVCLYLLYESSQDVLQCFQDQLMGAVTVFKGGSRHKAHY